MDTTTKIILTLLGIFLAALYSIQKRNPRSTNTPDTFQLGFYIKDKWPLHLISALTSVTLAATYHFLDLDTIMGSFMAEEFPGKPSLPQLVEGLTAWLCGFAPHLALSLLDNASKVFTPKIVKHDGETYYRK